MTVLTLDFSGWMQCRLATDPDPFDEPRGVTGYTFAVAGEPDLDRVIRFQPAGTVARRFGPTIGVHVYTVRRDGVRHPHDPLIGTSVDLLDDPVYEGRNGLAAAEREEPIVPFHLLISGGGVRLRHRHGRAPDPRGLPATGMRTDKDTLLTEAGIDDPVGRMVERLGALREALSLARDDTERVALARRIDALQIWTVAPLQAGLRRASRVVMTHGGTLEGDDLEVADPAGVIGFTPRAGWHVEIRAGAYDADTLCGWVSGTVALQG